MINLFSQKIHVHLFLNLMTYNLQLIMTYEILSLAVVYRSNRGMRVWVKTEDVLRVVLVPYFLLYIFLNFGTILGMVK